MIIKEQDIGNQYQNKKRQYNEDWIDDEEDFDYEEYTNLLFDVAEYIEDDIESKYGGKVHCQSVVPNFPNKTAQFNYIVDGVHISVDVELDIPYDPMTQYDYFLSEVEKELEYRIDFGDFD